MRRFTIFVAAIFFAGCYAPVVTEHGVQFYMSLGAGSLDIETVERVERRVISGYKGLAPACADADTSECTEVTAGILACLRGLPAWVTPGPSPVPENMLDLHLGPGFTCGEYAEALVDSVRRCLDVPSDRRSALKTIELRACAR